MPPLPNALRERFCLGLMAGKNNPDAYTAARGPGAPPLAKGSARTMGEILTRRPDVKARLAELSALAMPGKVQLEKLRRRDLAALRAETKTIMGVIDRKNRLSEIGRSSGARDAIAAISELNKMENLYVQKFVTWNIDKDVQTMLERSFTVEELRALVGQGRAIVEGKVVDPPGRVVSDGNVLDGGTTETVE